WQPTGIAARDAEAAWESVASHVAPLVRRARAHLLGALGLGPVLPERAIDLPDHVRCLYVTAWAKGRLIGCAGGMPDGQPDRWLARVAQATASDRRFRGAGAVAAEDVAVSVSFLRAPLDLGPAADAQWAAQVTRLGQQALEVAHRGQSGLLLPLVAVR